MKRKLRHLSRICFAKTWRIRTARQQYTDTSNQGREKFCPLPLCRWAGAPARRLLRRAVCPLGGQRARTGGGAEKSRGKTPDIETPMELTGVALLAKGCLYTY